MAVESVEPSYKSDNVLTGKWDQMAEKDATLPPLPKCIVEAEPVVGLQGRCRFKLMRNKSGKNLSVSLDEERSRLAVYEYLCHVAEVKQWMESCLARNLGETAAFEESIRNGIALAEVVNVFSEEKKKIFADTSRLQFRHSDNIHIFLDYVKEVGLPEVFYFELTDLYEKKCFPRVIYCIYALATLMSKRGKAKPIKRLVGELFFTTEEIVAVQDSLEASGFSLPIFNNVGHIICMDNQPVTKEVEDINPPIIEEEQVNSLPEMTTHEDELQDLEMKVKTERAARLVQTKFREHLALKEENERKTSEENRRREMAATKIQASFRGAKARKEIAQRLNYLNSQTDAAVKIQKFWLKHSANVIQDVLKSPESVTLSYIVSISHLWESSVQNVTSDKELENMRQRVVRLIKENMKLESDVSDLDTKIFLLIRNRITLEDIVNFPTKKKALKGLMTTSSNTNIDISGDESAGLSSNSRSAATLRGHYGELFYILQTQPKYLAKLLIACSRDSNSDSMKHLDRIVASIYGHSQNPREEYLLLNLIKELIKMEVAEYETVEFFWRSSPFFIRCILVYSRMSQNSRYIREIFKDCVKQVLDEPNLDLETDTVSIYRTLIRDEEISTGKKSKKPYDITFRNIQNDLEVRKVQQQHIDKLKEISGKFLDAIVGSVDQMPFGIKYIATQLKEQILRKFPKDKEVVIRFVGNILYYRYLNPAIVAPESFDVINRPINVTQRRNLAEIAKTLHQISVCKLFTVGDENLYSFNPFIKESYEKFMVFFEAASKVPSLDEYIGADFLMDIDGFSQPHSCYMDEGDIYRVHRYLLEYEADVTSSRRLDPLLRILKKIPYPPVEREDSKAEVCLKLTNVFPIVQDERSLYIKRLMNKVKRLVMIVIRTQTADNLLDLLESPVTEKHEIAFHKLLKENYDHLFGTEAEQRALDGQITDIACSTEVDSTNPIMRKSLESTDIQKCDSKSHLDSAENDKGIFGFQQSTNSFLKVLGTDSCASLFVVGSDGATTFTEFKRRVLELMSRLEDEGEVSKSNNYQDVLISIAKDMITRKYRIKRKNMELQTLKKAVTILQQKQGFLMDQKNSYQDYIESCLAKKLEKGRSKKSPQVVKENTSKNTEFPENRKSRSVSYEYTASSLYKKGIIVAIKEIPVKSFRQIVFRITSSQYGVFNISCTFFGVRMPDTACIHFEDLLARQYNKEDFIYILDRVKVNVNLLVYFLNRKFYT